MKRHEAHIRSLFPSAVFKKVEVDKAFFYPSKDSKDLHVFRREVDGYKVEETNDL